MAVEQNLATVIRELFEKSKPKNIVNEPKYYLNHTDENGTIHKILLDGNNTVTTQCPHCNREHSKSLFELVDLVRNDEECFMDVHIFCDVCSAEEVKAMEYAKQQG